MKVLFPGSFDPIHEGHLSIIKRASTVFDEVVILVAQNPKKKYSNIMSRFEITKKKVDKLELENVRVDFWNDQIMDYYEKNYFDILIRSIRSGNDIEWEDTIASEYKKQNIDCEVLYFLADQDIKHISSSKTDSSDKFLFVFDIDGTILNDQKKILPSFKKAFSELSKNGHTIVIATGRAPIQVKEIWEELNFNGYILGSGGASIYNIEKEKYLISKKIIPYKDIDIMIQKAYQMKRELLWSDGKKTYRVYFGHDPKVDIKDPLYFIGGTMNPKYDKWEDVKHTLNDGVIQVAIKSESWFIPKIKKELAPQISKEVYGVEVSNVYYEIGAKGVDKFAAIENIQNLFDIKNKNTYAFGDSQNDATMIYGCGHGIAMGNARVNIKKLADEIIESNNKDSISDYLIKNGFISE